MTDNDTFKMICCYLEPAYIRSLNRPDALVHFSNTRRKPIEWSIEELRAHGNKLEFLQVTNGLKLLTLCPRLTTLIMPHSNIGPDGAAAIARLEHLRELDLYANRVGDEGAVKLSQLALTRLKLSSNQIGDKGAIALAQAPRFNQLEELDLGGNQIGDEGAIALANSKELSALRVLHFWANPITDAGVLALKNLRLETLVLQVEEDF